MNGREPLVLSVGAVSHPDGIKYSSYPLMISDEFLRDLIEQSDEDITFYEAKGLNEYNCVIADCYPDGAIFIRYDEDLEGNTVQFKLSFEQELQFRDDVESLTGRVILYDPLTFKDITSSPYVFDEISSETTEDGTNISDYSTTVGFIGEEPVYLDMQVRYNEKQNIFEVVPAEVDKQGRALGFTKSLADSVLIPNSINNFANWCLAMNYREQVLKETNDMER